MLWNAAMEVTVFPGSQTIGVARPTPPPRSATCGVDVRFIQPPLRSSTAIVVVIWLFYVDMSPMEHTERRLRGSTARGYSGPRPGFEQRLDDGGVA